MARRGRSAGEQEPSRIPRPSTRLLPHVLGAPSLLAISYMALRTGAGASLVDVLGLAVVAPAAHASDTGLTWTSRASAVDNGWHRVVYGSGASSDPSQWLTVQQALPLSSTGAATPRRSAKHRGTWQSASCLTTQAADSTARRVPRPTPRSLSCPCQAAAIRLAYQCRYRSRPR